MVPRTEYAPFGGKRMQKAAARARSVNAARRMLQACVGRRVMKKVRRDDPRFGDALHHLSTATTLMEALDNPKLIRNGLSNEGVRLVCERLAGELQRSAEMTLGEEISSLFWGPSVGQRRHAAAGAKRTRTNDASGSRGAGGRYSGASSPKTRTAFHNVRTDQALPPSARSRLKGRRVISLQQR